MAYTLPEDFHVTEPGRIMSDAEGDAWIRELRSLPLVLVRNPQLPPLRPLFRCRDHLLQRRYAPAHHRSVRTACLWEEGGRLRMLIGHASRSKTPSGVLYNRRVRLVARFGLSAFERRDD